MGYQPAGRDHSITEVMWVTELDQELKEPDGKRIEKSYPRWETALPRKVEHQGILIGIGDVNAQEQVRPMVPVAFEAYARDGRAEWRMGVEHNRITVGCYNYSRWNDVYINAHRLNGEIGRALKESEHKIIALTLKYTDVFLWAQRDGEISIEVLGNDRERVPGEIYERYKKPGLWHLHQGWFKDEPGNNGERILEQMNIAGAQANTNLGPQPCVTLETTVKAEWPRADKRHLTLQHAFPNLGGANEREDGGAKVFSDLHDLSKDLLKEYLSKEMVLRIGLG